ncbi:MAG TPA: radical SAM protein [bacterium]|nr:radical SAM protein [bacterium]
MKVAMVFPPWTPKEVFTGNFGLFVGGRWHPLGILSVAAALREAGHDVRVFDGGLMTEDEMTPRLKAFGPGMVGMYLTTFSWEAMNSLAARIHREMPGVHVAVGGPLASGWKDRVLRESPHPDSVTVGEGEVTADVLARKLEAGGDLAEVEGIAYRDDGGIHLNPPRRHIPDINVLPFPARDLIDLERYTPPLGTYERLPALYLYSSRGCNGRCIFCWQLNAEGEWRARSAEKVLAEIDHVYETYKIKEVRFFDDNLVYDKERIHAVLDGIIERDYDLSFYASARADDVDPEIFRKMKKAKFWGILLGIESGVQKCLDAMNKGTTVEQNRRAVEWAHQAGLKTVTPFIFGIPGETFEDGLKSIQFAIDIDTDVVNFHAMSPFPGAELYEHVEKYGTVATDNVLDYTFEGCAFVPYTMKREQIQELRSLAFRRFYRRPRYVWKRLKAIRTWTDVKVLVAGGLAFLLTMLFRKEFTPHGAQL